ncbi:hypothetical protein PILCRDRAFT_821574 [Piloderma croceum F 1598]|uniref:Uncharacterized protein n=1 Tax=Piloderma croceum (strain F 1598) TaxID=765440 RepID=A0A0C3FN63_PILCF|nr:hypothetical protein PILCRDRAFT_821574 [Piloderma croceum F 1598]
MSLATVMQNQPQHCLPTAILSSLSTGENITYEIIPQISSFPQPLSSEVRARGVNPSEC